MWPPLLAVIPIKAISSVPLSISNGSAGILNTSPTRFLKLVINYTASYNFYKNLLYKNMRLENDQILRTC